MPGDDISEQSVVLERKYLQTYKMHIIYILTIGHLSLMSSREREWLPSIYLEGFANDECKRSPGKYL